MFAPWLAPRSGARLAFSSALVVGAAWPQVATASNCDLPPAIPDLGTPPCMVVVDRSADPVIGFEYTYDPNVIAMIPADQPQFLHFIAFRERPPTLPIWLNQAQVAAVQAKFDMTDECYPPDPLPEDVLEDNPDLAGTWVELTTDPIDVALDQADPGFDWDTTGMDPGTWYVFAYIESGRFPAWNMRNGIVTIVDDPAAPEAVPPGVFIQDLSLGTTYLPGQEYNLKACAYAMPGSEVDADWSVAVFEPDEPTWVPIAACVPVEEQTFQIPFIVTEEAGDWQAQFRAELRDPMGRTANTFTRFQNFGTADCIEPGIVTNPACDNYVAGDLSKYPDDRCGGAGTDGSGTGEGTDSDSGTSGTSTGENSGGACNCASNPAGDLGLLGLGLVLVRRRRQGWRRATR